MLTTGRLAAPQLHARGTRSPTQPQTNGVLGKALARAWRWQKLLDKGRPQLGDRNRRGGVDLKELRQLDPAVWSCLAPDIVEVILGGWADQRVMLESLERPLPVGWEEQRRNLLLSWQSAP